MANKQTINGFREEEIVTLRHWDKKSGEWVENSYPKVGGRLRLAHEQNETLAINTEVIRYDENIAVVAANVDTTKGAFHGIGMASVERDKSIAPAILELAETRAIARALRFAGYGVEYCSAEEISHLENGGGNGNGRKETAPKDNTQEERPSGSAGGNGGNGAQSAQTRAPGGNGGGNGNGSSSSSGNGNGQSGRLTNKQLNFIVNLGKGLGLNSKDLDQEAVSAFGVKMAHLSVKEASEFIEQLKGREEVPF